MIMNDGRYYPTHRPFAAIRADKLADSRRNRVAAPEPFMFTRLFLVIGIFVAACALFSRLTS